MLRLAKPEEIYSLRHKVLRPNQTLADCRWPRDFEATTFHVGAFLEDRAISIATFFPEAKPELPARNPYRLRGMATEPHVKGSGAGRKVLAFGMQQLSERNCDLLWCNAREIAFGFYEKMGLSYEGDLFDIPSVGPHKVMWIKIK